ncbi:MAG: VWA domain-containing protein, partial [Candidatus Neomarinimicrobiota bacterium]
MAWHHSWILGALPLLLILSWVDFRKRRTLRTQSDFGLRAELWSRLDVRKQSWKTLLGYGGWLLLTIAAAGPQIGTRVKPVERKGVDLVFALDVSESMNAPDIKPSRLWKAKSEIGQLIQHLKGDRVGIWSPNNAQWCITQFATAK